MLIRVDYSMTNVVSQKAARMIGSGLASGCAFKRRVRCRQAICRKSKGKLRMTLSFSVPYPGIVLVPVYRRWGEDCRRPLEQELWSA